MFDRVRFVVVDTRSCYATALTSHNLNLGTLLADDNKYGIIDFNVVLKGLNYQGKYPESSNRVNIGKKIIIGGNITDTTQAKVLYIP